MPHSTCRPAKDCHDPSLDLHLPLYSTSSYPFEFCNGISLNWKPDRTQAAHDRVQAAHLWRSVYLRCVCPWLSPLTPTRPHLPTILQVRLTACSRPVRGAISPGDTSLTPSPVRSLPLLQFTSASRADFRVRLLHLGGPHLRAKGYPLCTSLYFVFYVMRLVCRSLYVETDPSPPLISGRWRVFRQIDIRASKALFFPDTPHAALTSPVITHRSILFHPQPPDYPLSPFKMKFDPPLFHPNSNAVTFLHPPLTRPQR